MSSIDLSNLIHKLPSEESSLRCLESIFSRSGAENKEFSVNRLFDLCSPRSINSLKTILKLLVESGVLKKEVKVLSPSTRVFIASFEDVSNVPVEIFDPNMDLNIEITMKDIEIVYKLEKGN